MYKDFYKYVIKHRLFDDNDRLLVAVSGGVDSMVLVHLLHYHGFNFEIAHINYRLRGKESNEDEALVSSTCRKLDVPFHCYKVTDQEQAELKLSNLQSKARDIRYTFFDKVIQHTDCTLLLTAHHQDDKIENFMLSAFRGTGLKGLVSLKSKHDNIRRPLLYSNKNDILEFAKTHAVTYRKDLSNYSLDYQRNFIRHDIIPRLIARDHGFRHKASTTISNLTKDHLLFQELLDQKKQELVKDQGKYLSLDLSTELKQSATLFFQILRKYGLNATQSKDLIDSTTGTLIKTESHELLKDRGRILIRNKKPKIKIYSTIEPEDLGMVINYQSHILNIDFEQFIYIDNKSYKGSLILRNWGNGDTFKPYGLGGARKKVKDYLTDKKVNRFDKEDTLVLESEKQIIALLPYEVSYDYRITDKTEQILQIKKK